MRKRFLYSIALIVLVALAAIGGVYVGQHCFDSLRTHYDPTNSKAMDHNLHQQLGITSEQDAKLAKFEEDYQRQLTYLEGKLKLTNMELANAVKEEKRFGPRMEKAIMENHTILGEVQKLTMKHLFEMQTILTSEQNEKMNSVIADALYH